ncbi:MAG: hypothetical protein IKQ49_00655 [Eubacterium sp.]|nr:hypothetical protein [Eubacterium sp.]
MICNICGGEIPEGASNCPVCGSPAPVPVQGQQGNPYSMVGGNAEPSNPFGAMQQPQGMQPQGMQQGYGPEGFDPFAVQQPVAAPVQKKSHTGLIIGIIAAVFVIGGLIVCFALGVFGGGGGKDGKYYLQSLTSGGMTMDADTLKAYGVDLSSMYLEINGEKGVLYLDFMGNEEKAECEVKFDGDNVTLTKNGESISGTYNSSDNSISVSIDGSGMVFKKK